MSKTASNAIGELEEYRVVLEPGKEITTSSVIRLQDGRQLVVKSIHGTKATQDGKTLVWGRGRHLRNVEV